MGGERREESQDKSVQWRIRSSIGGGGGVGGGGGGGGRGGGGGVETNKKTKKKIQSRSTDYCNKPTD